MKKLTIKEKLLQMFVLGYQGIVPDKQFINLIENNLGGVIFFAENFSKRENFKELIKEFNKKAKTPPFLSIDQEGGLVERTIALDEKISYISPMALAQTKVSSSQKHYEIMAKDLTDLGLNLNYAPVLDANTNPKNPVIGIRSFSDNPETISEFAKTAVDEFKKQGILAVGKHFPGHGEAFVDSHLDMPVIDMNFKEFEKKHIKSFKTTINEGLDAMMIAHVHYPFFNSEKIPASLSKNVIQKYLVKQLGFKGLVISDDMVMGGIAKYFGVFESIKMGIDAGIDLFIFRNLTDELLFAIEKLEQAVKQGEISQERIDFSVEKILAMKTKYMLKKNDEKLDFNSLQKEIDKIAENAIKTIKKGGLLPLKKENKYKIISINRKEIFNLSFDNLTLKEVLADFQAEEINYSLNPSEEEIKNITAKIKPDEIVIFIAYNAHLNQNQLKLVNEIKNPKIMISAATPYDIECFKKEESVLASFGLKPSSIKALGKSLIE